MHGAAFQLCLICLLVPLCISSSKTDLAGRLQEWRRGRGLDSGDQKGFQSGERECVGGNAGEQKEAKLTQLSRVIVTGASSNHFRSMKNFIESALEQTNETIVVFDLGLEDAEKAELGTFSRLVFRKLRLQEYGEHVASLQAASPSSSFALDGKRAGLTYIGCQVFAWKPILIHHILQEVEHVLWLDAGCLLQQNVDSIFAILVQSGLFLTAANSYIGQLTHPSMMEQFEAHDLKSMIQVNGGVVGFSRSAKAYDEVLMPWRKCAMRLTCIAPHGSSRENHRQDQSVLSILVRKQGREVHELSSFGIAVHQDQDANLKITFPLNGTTLEIGEEEQRSGVFNINIEVFCPSDVEQCCLRGSMSVFLNRELWMQYPEQFWCRANVVDQSQTGQFAFQLEETQEFSLLEMFEHGQAHSCAVQLLSPAGKVSHRVESSFVLFFITDEPAD